MADTRTLKLSLLADVQKFLAGMDKAEKGTKGLNSTISTQSKQMAKSFAVVGIAAAAFATKIGLDAVQAASDLNEEVSKSEVIFGDVADEIQAFSKTADRSLGISQTEALKAASTFATFGKAAGLTGVDLSKFSKRATTLASDLASFYNTNAEDAINAIGAALRGESEPIRRYGVLLNDATLKAKAMEMGLYDGKGALDVQAKSLAAYEVILDQTGDAQGDFSRTSDGLAGQQKILRAQLENLKTTMGTNLLPVMQNVVTQANFVAAAFGGKDPEGLSERARELAGVYDGQGAGGYNLGLALKNLGDQFAKLFKAFTDDGDETTDGMTELANALTSIANGINAVSTAYSNAKSVFRDVKTTGIGQFLFGSWGPGGMFPGLLNPAAPASRAAGGPVMGNQVTRVGEFGPELFVPSGVSGSIRKDNGSGSGNTFIFNGVIDGESARRSIEKLLQTSARRTGAINLAGANL
jgi:hypothetical protein